MIILEARLTAVKALTTQVNVTFAVKNVSDDDELRLTQFMDTQGYMLFNGSRFKREVESVMKDVSFGIDEKGQSKSRILRGRIFQYWANTYRGELDFEDYYNKSMDALISKIK